MRKYVFFLVVFLMLSLVSTCGASFKALPIFPGSVMFVVNDPQDLVLVPIQLLMDETEDRLTRNKVISAREKASFLSFLREHGVPNAGSGNARVGLIVSPKDPANEGVLVIQGSFDKDRILEMLSRRYAGHVNEHINDQRQDELGIGAKVAPISGYSTHRFVLPVRDRVLHVVDMGGAVLFASHRRGDTGLLKKTIKVMQKGTFNGPQDLNTKVSFTFQPTPNEKIMILQQLNSAYTRYKAGRMEHRRGVKRFAENIRQIVTDKKFVQVKGYVQAMEKVTFKVNRSFSADVNSKDLTVTLQFSSQDAAQQVKAGLVKHLVAEMKKPANSSNVAALRNPQIYQSGKSVVLKVLLETEQDQLHTFSIMAGYVAKAVIATAEAPAVRRLKTIADRQAAAGRMLEKHIAVEKSRTSFFSFGRKFSLMWKSMKTRSNIRRCEDTYVDLKNDPKTISNSIERLADAAGQNMEILDSLIELRRKDFASEKSKSPTPRLEMVQMYLLKRQMIESARALIINAKSPAVLNLTGPLSNGVLKKLEALAQKTGGMGPIFNAAGTQAAAPMGGGVPDGVQVSVDQYQFSSQQVTIPLGMTLEQALSAYMDAYQNYASSIETGDSEQTKKAYDDYMKKFQIYQAIREKNSQK